MQTAMQMAIEHYENLSAQGSNQAYVIAKFLKEKFLPLEKQQIIDAYWGGLNGSINDYSESKQVGSEIIDIKYGKGADQYYNETYGSKGSDATSSQTESDETFKVWECCGMENCICKGSDETNNLKLK